MGRINLFITPAAPEPHEDIVRICRDGELSHGEAHALRAVAGEDVTEVTRWDYELELGGFWVRYLLADMEAGKEVIDRLGKDACPVDGVDSTQAVLLIEGLVCEQRLHDVPGKRKMSWPTDLCRLCTKSYLAVFECTLHGDVVHVRIRDSRHLRLLHG